MTEDLKNKRFIQIRTLAHRWDSSTDRIYDLISKGALRAWHPEGKVGRRGIMVEVRSVLEIEASGFVNLGE